MVILLYFPLFLTTLLHVCFWPKILSAGPDPTVFHWQLNGDPKSQVPCTPNSVFTIQVNEKSTKKVNVRGQLHLFQCWQFMAHTL